MSEITIAVPNAILFVFDSEGEGIEVPEYVPGQVTSATTTAVSVNTRTDVDGGVIVRLANQLPAAEKHGCNIVFEHSIPTPSRRVIVVTSELERILEVDVKADTVRLSIAVDDAHSPCVVCIEAQ